ncbi:hypothetical protein IWQ60_011467 [Tieghemiomyces parasiticus]|uniref:UBA domain-containing protein n=1 Tax=Tieghemiomyces parasiticus TaxID=78921 RepID=A0A9W8DLI5_9FUNG|nr:hypothetical protein IWQ60_011467 [Tieghemiomyces parasiticus]
MRLSISSLNLDRGAAATVTPTQTAVLTTGSSRQDKTVQQAELHATPNVSMPAVAVDPPGDAPMAAIPPAVISVSTQGSPTAQSPPVPVLARTESHQLGTSVKSSKSKVSATGSPRASTLTRSIERIRSLTGSPRSPVATIATEPAVTGASDPSAGPLSSSTTSSRMKRTTTAEQIERVTRPTVSDLASRRSTSSAIPPHSTGSQDAMLRSPVWRPTDGTAKIPPVVVVPGRADDMRSVSGQSNDSFTTSQVAEKEEQLEVLRTILIDLSNSLGHLRPELPTSVAAEPAAPVAEPAVESAGNSTAKTTPAAASTGASVTSATRLSKVSIPTRGRAVLTEGDTPVAPVPVAASSSGSLNRSRLTLPSVKVISPGGSIVATSREASSASSPSPRPSSAANLSAPVDPVPADEAISQAVATAEAALATVAAITSAIKEASAATASSMATSPGTETPRSRDTYARAVATTLPVSASVSQGDSSVSFTGKYTKASMFVEAEPPAAERNSATDINDDLAHAAGVPLPMSQSGSFMSVQGTYVTRRSAEPSPVLLATQSSKETTPAEASTPRELTPPVLPTITETVEVVKEETTNVVEEPAGTPPQVQQAVLVESPKGAVETILEATQEEVVELEAEPKSATPPTVTAPAQTVTGTPAPSPTPGQPTPGVSLPTVLITPVATELYGDYLNDPLAAPLVVDEMVTQLHEVTDTLNQLIEEHPQIADEIGGVIRKVHEAVILSIDHVTRSSRAPSSAPTVAASSLGTPSRRQSHFPSAVPVVPAVAVAAPPNIVVTPAPPTAPAAEADASKSHCSSSSSSSSAKSHTTVAQHHKPKVAAHLLSSVRVEHGSFVDPHAQSGGPRQDDATPDPVPSAPASNPEPEIVMVAVVTEEVATTSAPQPPVPAESASTQSGAEAAIVVASVAESKSSVVEVASEMDVNEAAQTKSFVVEVAASEADPVEPAVVRVVENVIEVDPPVVEVVTEAIVEEPAVVEPRTEPSTVPPAMSRLASYSAFPTSPRGSVTGSMPSLTSDSSCSSPRPDGHFYAKTPSPVLERPLTSHHASRISIPVQQFGSPPEEVHVKHTPDESSPPYLACHEFSHASDSMFGSGAAPPFSTSQHFPPSFSDFAPINSPFSFHQSTGEHATGLGHGSFFATSAGARRSHGGGMGSMSFSEALPPRGTSQNRRGGYTYQRATTAAVDATGQHHLHTHIHQASWHHTGNARTSTGHPGGFPTSTGRIRIPVQFNGSPAGAARSSGSSSSASSPPPSPPPANRSAVDEAVQRELHENTKRLLAMGYTDYYYLQTILRQSGGDLEVAVQRLLHLNSQ